MFYFETDNHEGHITRLHTSPDGCEIEYRTNWGSMHLFRLNKTDITAQIDSICSVGKEITVKTDTIDGIKNKITRVEVSGALIFQLAKLTN